MSRQRFEGRVAIVTGGASGIGRAVTERLLAEGATVYAFDLKADEAEASDRLIPVSIDISDVSAITAATAEIHRIDHLVNAAGMILSRPIEQISETDWDLIFGVNAKGTFFLTQACAPKLTDGIGSVVNVSSVGAISGVSYDAADYHATKTAVLSITRSWARALAGRGVRVNSIMPGLTKTPLLSGAYDSKADDNEDGAELLDSAASGIPLGRLADPGEIADAILFLLSSESSYMTGASINVSGGVVMV